MMSFDEILNQAYNSIEQPDSSWKYSTFKTYKRTSKKIENKLGKYLLRRKRNEK